MIASDGTHDYGYNSLYEITEEKINNIVEHSYDYDPVANREVVDGVIYIPNSLNQYDSVGGVTYLYDGNGNLRDDGLNTSTYDEESRLTTVTTPTTFTAYTYDAFNRRVSKTVGGETIYFINDGDREIEERKASGQLKANYVYGAGIDEVLTMDRGGYTFFYQYDGLGSVSEVTDLVGGLIESYAYDPYGQPTILTTDHK